jgi:hypothetical protein
MLPDPKIVEKALRVLAAKELPAKSKEALSLKVRNLASKYIGAAALTENQARLIRAWEIEQALLEFILTKELPNLPLPRGLTKEGIDEMPPSIRTMLKRSES